MAEQRRFFVGGEWALLPGAGREGLDGYLERKAISVAQVTMGIMVTWLPTDIAPPDPARLTED